MKKLHTLDQLKKILQVKRQEGKRIVLANGGFDLIHVGHIRYLKEAKKEGDILLVALNSDSSVRKLKGPGRPILAEDERSEIISSFYFVDYVIIFNEDTVNNILRTLKPDVHAKGSDYTKETVPERSTVLEYGGEIAITGGAKVRSTSDIFRSIAAKIKAPEH
ncbi:MAG: adenylyltransferase/cytidyltransferase family protein [Candidatus Aminicenantes bacterium]|nr:adenylyltransferase/cytidyltransferase family protein [Candidatus Aminicenantes bacterium]